MKLLNFILKYPSFCITVILMFLLILQREVLNRSTDKKVKAAINNMITTAPVTIQDSVHVDTLYYPYSIPKPYPVFHDTGTTQYVILPADTLSIVKDYLSRNIYKRVLVNDTNAHIILIDTVSRNQLTQGTLKAEFYPRSHIITRDKYLVTPSSGKLYMGITIGLNPQKLFISPALFFNTRNDHLYGLGYDLINRSPQVSVLFKLSLKGR